MTEVLHSPSSSSSSSLQTHEQPTLFLNQDLPEDVSRVTDDNNNNNLRNRGNNRDNNQLSLLALLLALFRKSFLGVNSNNKNTVAEERLDLSGMEIGWPTDVRHVAHVTFDRFNGFLGLPVEFEPEVLRRAPSASATVFGVSTESMQLSYDSRGNSVPVILILMQQRLYSLGGLQAEGIFRINADNNQEEHLRNQLNSGVVPDGIDVHCLAGLIKAWFRELPTGVLDPLSPEQVIQCQSEEDCTTLCRLLPPTETALLDWAINLMADVVQYEHLNKMNSHNIAMVFAPNMTQMADPLTALMYAVQVMNFLKTLITKTLREREDAVIESSHGPPREPPSDENGDQGPRLSPHVQQNHDENEEKEHEFATDEDHLGYLTASEESDGPGSGSSNWSSQSPPIEPKTHVVNHTREPKQVAQSSVPDKSRPLVSNLSSINSQTEKIIAWR
ncbi:putative Rho GTPase activation protein [Helianthus annuus]|uniref:Putative rho GTPase activating protein with PAK-box/P21-Rho-binding domain-containing protein n=1 Tax=Helianthus annuus TaxID=4232 RepID=A0A251VIC5_HELAN|nr:rho GTPase-activating protein 5 [Helianthus annuus]KAF5819612.1 putative Rho GTPase activation protein [Helianthus annuus]KAJ0619771.1 putative Rho GTPase activation protein [Helianthus annuus]KAJ0787213.1 putative Rho GTPase activation protein [Helianthus annuus]